MGFWSTLGKIGLAAAPIVAAPFTGGASLAGLGGTLGTIAGAAVKGGAGALGALGANAGTDLSQTLGGMAGGRAAGRQSAADLLLRRGELEGRNYATAGNLALGRGKLANDAYQSALSGKALESNLAAERAHQAMTGDLLSNVQDVRATGPARVMNSVIHFQGGRRPSALGPNARAAGAKLSALALDKLGNEGLPTVPTVPDLPTAPTAPTLPETGFTDKLISGAGAASGLLGVLGKYLPSVQTQKRIRPYAGGTGLPIGNPNIPTFGGWANG